MTATTEADAAEVLLLRAIERAPHPAWSADDAAWATRVAREQVGRDAAPVDFLVARARAAWPRLGPREPALAQWRSWAGPPRLAGWGVALVGVALLAGLLADQVGGAQRINLLAPPVWAVLVWNLAVYVGLAVRELAARGAPGRLARALAGWRQRAGQRAGAGGSAVAASYAADRTVFAAPAATARAAALLHLAAAALAVGLIGGLYLRGLVLDYRVGWQSTFLDAPQVQRLLGTLLAPASAVSGIALPDVAGVQALRVTGAEAPAAAGGAAAPWIHLYAWQLVLLVVAPRLALAAVAAWRAHRRQHRATLPLDEPYFRRLLGWQRGAAPRLTLCPYAQTPPAEAVDALRAALGRAFGPEAVVQVAPTVAFGAEEAFAAPADDGTRPVALFELGATPEAENQGRFVQALARADGALVLVDESAFRRRFGDTSPRLPERRAAWAALAAAAGCTALFVDLRAPDAAALEAALIGWDGAAA